MTTETKVKRVIALEEAFLYPKLFELYPLDLQEKYSTVKDKLLDVGPGRIKRMDEAGIDMQVLSHVQPGIEMLNDTTLAIQLSEEINNWLGDIVQKYPTRFAGFATLPMQSPQDAADELEKLLARHPDQVRGHLLLGNLYAQKLDKPHLAREHYMTVLTLDPQNSQGQTIRNWLKQNQ